MHLKETNTDGVTVVEPTGRIDLANAGPLEKRLVELIRSGSHRLLLDFRHVQYISSAGFRALLIARKLVDQTGGNLVLCGMSPEIKRVFAIGTFTDLFTICATGDEGLAKLR
jgi:anti-anti-sigma factor